MGQLDIGTILIATDFSKEAEGAFGQALGVAERTRAQVLVMWAEPEQIAPPAGAAIYASAVAEVESMVETVHAEAVARLEALADRARGAGVTADVRVAHGEPDDAIVAVAEEVGADLVVTGTKGVTGFKRFFLGSVAQNVLRKSTTNVMIVRGEADVRFQRILIPCDFSPASEKALRITVAVAPPNAEITLFHAWQYPPGVYGVNSPNPKPGPLADLRDRIVERNLQRGAALIEKYRGDGYGLTYAQDYGPAASLIHQRLESETYDLVAMGTHGYRGFQRLILGSVAETTVRHANCSVLVAHAADAASAVADE